MLDLVKYSATGLGNLVKKNGSSSTLALLAKTVNVIKEALFSKFTEVCWI